MRQEFKAHTMRREVGCTWRCAKSGTNIYGFRVTWAPGSLIITGDIGDLVVNHYSFTDPWAAAAWVNGAGWDYFMEKAVASKEYDHDATAEYIVETAYRQMRDNPPRVPALMEEIVDRYGDSYEGDHNDPEGRKYACRELLTSEISEAEAYDMTSDGEMLIYRYPGRYRILYEAAQWWATRMWETEPAWHKALRFYRRTKAELRDLKRHPIVFGPVRYAQYDARGRVIYLNGSHFWRYVCQGGHARYEGIVPLRLFRLELGKLGLWRVQGSTIPDRGPTDSWGRPSTASQFKDVRE